MKRYEELNFTDDFVFCKVLENNKELCKRLLEIILDKKIRDIVYLKKQEPFDAGFDKRGIRLDVYIEDDEDSVYDIEMQTSSYKELPRRSRYYQGMMDSRLLKRGVPYTDLKKSFVIFICMGNPFPEYELHKYVFRYYCDSNKDLCLNDDAYRVFLTPKGNANDISDELRDFLEYIVSQIPKSDFTSRLDIAVAETLDTDAWRTEYMFLYEKIEEERALAREEGLAEGRAEGITEGIAEGRAEGRVEGRVEGRIKSIALILKNGTKEDAVRLLNASENEIKQAEALVL